MQAGHLVLAEGITGWRRNETIVSPHLSYGCESVWSQWTSIHWVENEQVNLTSQ